MVIGPIFIPPELRQSRLIRLDLAQFGIFAFTPDQRCENAQLEPCRQLRAVTARRIRESNRDAGQAVEVLCLSI